MRRWLLFGALILPLAVGAAGDASFSGVFVRDQDAQTMERGMLRADLETLRGIRSRSQVFVIVAPSEAAWQRDVAPDLQDALDGSPSAFRSFASLLPPTIGRAGPGIGGAILSLKMPHNRGTGLLAVHLPPLLNQGRAGDNLLNSVAANQGHLVSGVDVPKANDFVTDWMTAFYAPSWASALGRAGPPRVPLRPLPGDGKGSFVLFEGDAEAGDGGSEIRERLWEVASADVVPLGPMETFPRRLDGLDHMLRTIRLEADSLVSTEGAYATLSQAPQHWTVEARTVRHPDRYLSLVAPVTAQMNDGALHSVVVGIFGWYTPLLLTLDEAPLYLDVPARRFAEAVHRGDVPFFRDGESLYFYRGHLDLWAAGAAGIGKTWTVEEAREEGRKWAKRWKLRNLERALQGALPERLVSIPEDERAELVDDRVAARAHVDREDLPAWLKHFEPGLKPGKRTPSWSLSFDESAARLPASFSLEGPWEPPKPKTPAKADDRWAARGSSGGGGAVTLGEATKAEAVSVAFDGDVGLEIVELYASEDYCRTGGTMGAVVEFEVVGVPEGSVARLKLEWDLMVDGRPRGMDTWPVERGAGTHEVAFDVPCPKEPGAAELAFVLLDPAKDLMIEAALPFDVRHPGGRSWSKLEMPTAKTCLGAAGEGKADSSGFSVGGSVGLSGDQINDSVRGFQRQTLRCSDGRAASGTVVLDLVVGCDGRVSDAEVLSDQTGADGFADCVADVMEHAPFPAHDMPDGVSFSVPLRYE